MHGLVLIAGCLLALISISIAMMIDGKQMSINDAIMKAATPEMRSKMFDVMQDNETVLVELDILYQMDTYMNMMKDMEYERNKESTRRRRKKRKAIRAERYRWPNARVPYDMANDFSARDRSIIMAAIDDYHQFTCIRFVPASNNDRSRVRFQNGGGCSSYVGMIGGSQPISLAPGCRYKGIVIHEMGHAIGFQHEQTRPDRDNFVEIREENIQPGVEYNFMGYTVNQVNNFDVPYDYTSVMHYSQTAFTRNGQPTIIALQRQFQNAMGNREGFSFRDIQLANTVYDCAAANGCAQRNCPQGAFQGPDCQCWCDSGNRANPVRRCSETEVTVAPEITTTALPMTCEDRRRECSYWAGRGYCTGRYENYMRDNCALSCQLCPTTTTPAPTTTPSPSECSDQHNYCEYWARRGECEKNPDYMMEKCKVSCDACEGSVSTCVDSSERCSEFASFCNFDYIGQYVQAACRATCNVCTAGDATSKPVTTPGPAPLGPTCQDKVSPAKCRALKSGECMHLVKRKLCAKTCGAC